MVIYADVIFVANFISAYIMLYILGRAVNRVKIRKKRLLIASLVGAISALVIFCTEISVLLGYVLRIVTVLLMIFISFYEQRKQILQQIVWLILMSGIMVFSMMLITAVIKNTVSVVIKSGIVYFDIEPKIFLITLAISYFIMIFFLKVFKNRKNKKYYLISVTHNDKTITVTALFDSGNLLKEPITGKDVSIVEWEQVRNLFGAEYDFCDIENHAEEMKLWVIPYSSLGNSSGMLFAFLADKITIPEEKKTIDKTFIGIYGGILSKNKEYQALINSGLL